MATTETKKFYPGAYSLDYNFTSIEGATNPVGKGSDNTTYADIEVNVNTTTTYYCYWPFDLSAIPNNATIDAINCVAKVDCNMRYATFRAQLYSGSKAKGTYTTIVSGTVTKAQLTPGNWTRAELNNCKLRISVKPAGNGNGTGFQFYGADLTVTYTYQGEKFMLKLGGKYNDVARVFKKVNGIWVEQEELANVIEDGVRYQNGGEYVAPKKTVTIKGTGNSSNGYVTINGTKYTSAATVQVEGGTTVGITLDCDMYNLLCKVTLNGTVVHENSTTNAETYYHIVDSDCTITLASTGSGGGYKADIVTT